MSADKNKQVSRKVIQAVLARTKSLIKENGAKIRIENSGLANLAGVG